MPQGNRIRIHNLWKRKQIYRIKESPNQSLLHIVYAIGGFYNLKRHLAQK